MYQHSFLDMYYLILQYTILLYVTISSTELSQQIFCMQYSIHLNIKLNDSIMILCNTIICERVLKLE